MEKIPLVCVDTYQWALLKLSKGGPYLAIHLVEGSVLMYLMLFQGPVVISRDHHDVSGTDSPYRETSNIYDGSAFCAGSLSFFQFQLMCMRFT